MTFIHSENAKVLCFTRTNEEETILVMVNFSKFPQPVELNLKDFKGYTPVEAMSRSQFPTIEKNKPYFFTLAPHSYYWFELKKLRVSSAASEALPLLAYHSMERLLSSVG